MDLEGSRAGGQACVVERAVGRIVTGAEPREGRVRGTARDVCACVGPQRSRARARAIAPALSLLGQRLHGLFELEQLA
eukprot:6128373-Pleurochrysis_carterae.AAC.1